MYSCPFLIPNSCTQVLILLHILHRNLHFR
nr:MAG TPA: hypothetical protein [Caudoviricetes sp.]